MDWVIYLFGSGFFFFLGVGLLLAALLVLSFVERGALRRFAAIGTFTGMILIALSATPLPIWYYLLAATGTSAWLIAELSPRPWFERHRSKLRLLVLALWGAGVGIEAPYHWMPGVDLKGQRELYIIGDSVAAGMGDNERIWTWPTLLTRSGDMPIHDFSQMGATAASAFKQAQGLPGQGGIVLLEIGGNDLLGSTTAEKFERDLAKLLDRVCAPERVVLMFELPLPPLANQYGRIQRRLAAQHGVELIPKRIFADVLTADGATLDSVHLSKQGHQRMAEIVRTLVKLPRHD